MKTIEERSRHYASMYMHPKLYEQAKREYIKIATEQKSIDIEKAWQWIKNNFDKDEGGEIEYCFRKAMEE